MHFKRQIFRYNIKLRTGQITELLELLTEKRCVEFPLNVLPKVWLKSNPEESGKRSTSLDLVLPKSDERFPEKKINAKETKIPTEDIQKRRRSARFAKFRQDGTRYSQKFICKKGNGLTRLYSSLGLLFSYTFQIGFNRGMRDGVSNT